MAKNKFTITGMLDKPAFDWSGAQMESQAANPTIDYGDVRFERYPELHYGLAPDGRQLSYVQPERWVGWVQDPVGTWHTYAQAPTKEKLQEATIRMLEERILKAHQMLARVLVALGGDDAPKT